MQLNDFTRSFADEIGGQYSEYDIEKSVIIVPLEENRFQAVLCQSRKIEDDDRKGLVFTSKVCEYSDSIDLKELLKENYNFHFAKFIIVDDVIKIEASALDGNVTHEMLKEMIVEVAKSADEWEFKLTGLDVN
jgi:hypothetical protein